MAIERGEGLADVEPPPATSSGDGRSGFEAFYEVQYATTKRLAYLLTGSVAGAEDVTQDAFVAVYARFGDLTHPDRYLRTVTVNGCRRVWRRRARERSRLPDLIVDEVGLPPETIELLSGVRNLPSRQQTVLVLRYWARMTEAEVAATLRCPIGTVKTLHRRALAALRREFS